MKHIYQKYSRCLLLFFVCLGLCISSFAQSQPSVLKIDSDQLNFDLNIDLQKDLLDQGVANTGTLEFWVKRTAQAINATDEVWSLTNELLGDDHFSLVMKKGKMFVNVGGTSFETPISGLNTFYHNNWNHISLVVDNQSKFLRVYVNSVQYSFVSYAQKIKGYLHLRNQPGANLLLAEIRGWAKIRTKQQLQDFQYKSISANNSNELQDNYNLGLRVAYVDNDSAEVTYEGLNNLRGLEWNNKLFAYKSSLTGVSVPNSFVISSVDLSGGGTSDFVNLRTDLTHPVYNLSNILVSASKGNGKQLNASNKDGVFLKWGHVKNAVSYNVYRKNISQAGGVFTKIKTENNLVGLNVSDDVIYFDDGILPSQLYEYKIEAFDSNGLSIGQGVDVGFVFPNSEIKGAITSSQQIGTKKVKVIAELTSGQQQGNALHVKPSSEPIVVSDVEEFRSNPENTIEFWYKGDAVSSGSNSIFNLGDLSVVIQGDKLTAKIGSEVSRQAQITNDAKWHHYAIAYNASETDLYQDGVHLGTFTGIGLDLSRVVNYTINKNVTTSYKLDELRTWRTKRTAADIYNYYDIVISGKQTDLIAYYRFDLRSSNRIFNLASGTLGRLVGNTIETLEYVGASDLKKLPYGVFTDEFGKYNFNTINAAANSVYGSAITPSFKVVPSKPNHNFVPQNKVETLSHQLAVTPVDISFTDNSVFSISGRLLYRIADSGEPSGHKEFYGLQGTTILVDGSAVNDPNDLSKGKTDKVGNYIVSAGPGKHKFEIGQPVFPSAGIGAGANGINNSSLKLDGERAYVNSSFDLKTSNESFTWSACIKPIQKVSGDKLVRQTILQWGDFALDIVNDNVVELVYNNGNSKLSTSIQSLSTYNFVAFTFDKSTNTLGLKVDDSFVSGSSAGAVNIDAEFYLGAKYNATSKKYLDYANIYIDDLEYRTVVLNNAKLEDLRKGELFDNDVTELKLSYTFEHKKGVKALNMLGLNLDNKYLSLNESAVFTSESSSTYARKYKYDYRAINDIYVANAGDDFYDLNIIDVLSDLNFENTTRRKFIGNIVVPCENSVGQWTGKIKRTDIAFPSYEVSINSANFNANNSIFTIDNLLPGHYTVEMKNVDTGRTIKSSSIDLTKYNATYDFEYRNPLKLEYKLYAFDLKALNNKKSDILKGKKGEVSLNCKGAYEFNTGAGIFVEIVAFEEYAGGKKCPVENAKVNIGGDMITSPMELATGIDGKVNFINQIGSPNFVGDYSRNLQLTASHLSRSFSANGKAYVLGAEKLTSDFTLLNPDVGIVLHDPPGDSSTATISKGATFSHSYSFEKGTNFELDMGVSLGTAQEIEHETLVLTAPAGIGGATGISIKLAKVSSSVGIGNSSSVEHRKIGGNGYSLSLTQDISTSDDQNLVGEDADIFIGMSNVLTFGKGRKLTIENCMPKLITNTNVVKADAKTPFFFTKRHIETKTIPDIQRLLLDEIKRLGAVIPEDEIDYLDLTPVLDKYVTDQHKKDSDDVVDYLHQIDRWNKILQSNSDLLKPSEFDKAPKLSETTSKVNKEVDNSDVDVDSGFDFLDTEISFSAGTEVSYEFERLVSNSSGSSTTGSNTTSGGLEIEFIVGGTKYKMGTETSISVVKSNLTEDVSENSRVDAFTFSDDDAKDQFNVKIRRDPRYDTPMFLTNSGQSRCPYERGTVPREGVEVLLDNAVKYGIGNNSIIYNVTFRNTQKANDAIPKTYDFSLDTGTNPKGAQVSFNGSGPSFGAGIPVSITFEQDSNSPTGVEQEKSGQLVVTKGVGEGETVDYDDMVLVFESACESDQNGYLLYREDLYAEQGIVPVQEYPFSARFVGPCIDHIEMQKPINDWVVNNQSAGKLNFRFKLGEITKDDAPDDLSILFEYAIAGNSSSTILKEVPAKDLKQFVQNDGFIDYDVDVSSLADGDYQFRITPKCDTGGAGNPGDTSNPTAFVTGKIATQAATVVTTNPTDGGLLTAGNISIEYSSGINPATVGPATVALRGILGGVPRQLKSAEFDVISDEVQIPHLDAYNLDGAFTIEMWVSAGAYPGSGVVPILKKGDNFNVGLTSKGYITLNGIVQSSRKIPVSQWTHIAIVYDGISKVQMYFNTVPCGGGNLQSVATNADPIIISDTDNNKSFIGRLDEIRIWNTKRTPNEISGNYKKQLLGNENGMVAYFVMDDIALDGVDGASGEAIRDFVGLASGTTATGLSFVTGDENAAPLNKDQVVTNLQFTTALSNNNTTINITPSFTAKEMEGAQLTVLISDKKIEDTYGNKVDKYSWNFSVNKNFVKWSTNNIVVNQPEGVATTIDNVDLSNASGGSRVLYKFKQLPSWLTLKSGANLVGDNFIDAGHVNDQLVFEVAPYLNSGTYRGSVYVETFSTHLSAPVSTGVESFLVEVNVSCASPPYSFDPSQYSGTMHIYGNIIFEEGKSLDTADKIAAYLGNELRGSANVGSNGLVDLAVHGNQSDSGRLTFKVWNASLCTEFEGIVENYNFTRLTTIGTSSNPVSFTVGPKLVSRIPVVTGFQEISFNVQDNAGSNVISLIAIRGLAKDSEIRDVITDNLLAKADANGILVGENSITNLDVRKAYLLKSTSNTLLQASGVKVPVNLNIDIHKKGSGSIPVSNAIAYFPSDLQTTPYALRSLTATSVSENDMISRRGLSATYTSANGWTGTLTYLTPGLGYIYTSTNDGVLNYTGVAQSKSGKMDLRKEDKEQQRELLAKSGWKVDQNQYKSFMYINAVLDTDLIDENGSYVIASFVDEKLSGTSLPITINDQKYYYLGIGANREQKVTFKLFDGVEYYDLDNRLKFKSHTYTGTVDSPYKLSLTNSSDFSSIDEKLSTIEKLTIIPNPISSIGNLIYKLSENQKVTMRIYNVLGKLIYTGPVKQVEAGVTYQQEINVNTLKLPAGIYLCVLEMEKETKTLKFMVK
ncbi:MAG: T9SS type A sorting domain-containing protein [Marinifilum sp.]|nr:T9SS type A sorting domain-containing protein [Marinifilum sp.]